MVARTFAISSSKDGGIVYDPLSGQTFAWPNSPKQGRCDLTDVDLEGLAELTPADLNRTYPVSVCWSPIVECNLRCPHCLDDKTVRSLGREDRTRIAQFIAAAPILGVDVSGGEPLLLRDLPELTTTLRTGPVVSVTTNGWLLERRAAELAGRVDALRVSLDGATKEAHDCWRKHGSFERALHGIRRAVELEIPVQIQFVAMRSTIDQLQPLVDLAGKLGVDGVSVLQFLPIGEGKALGSTEWLEDDYVAERIAQLTRPSGMRIRLRCRKAAGGFTVVRADGRVWRNSPDATSILAARPLLAPTDLALTADDGSA